MNKLKLFLDSNIFLAGLASTTGASAEVLRLAEAKTFRILVSDLVIQEAERNFKKKLPEFLPFFYYAIENLKLEVIPDTVKKSPQITKIIPKDSDCIIFQTAQMAKPDYFLSLDKKHFHQIEVKKIALFKIVTPAQFLFVWRGINSFD